MSKDRIEFAKVLIGRNEVGIQIIVPMSAWYEFLEPFRETGAINPLITKAMESAIESIDSRTFFVERDD